MLEPLVYPISIPLLAGLLCLLLPTGWQRGRAWLAVAATALALLAAWQVFAAGNQVQAAGGWLLLQADGCHRRLVIPRWRRPISDIILIIIQLL